MSKLETNTIDTVSGTNTLQVGDGNVATINLGKSGDTINVPSGATFNINGTAGTGVGVAGITSSADGTAITIDSSENVSMAQNVGFNSGFGSATTVYGVRAWVNFNGSGTLAIRDSGGVSSVTDVGTGAYTVNFSNNMPDVNFTGMTNPGPVISTAAKQFNFCTCSLPDAVGSINITNRFVDVDDAGFSSADNDYVGFIAIR